MSPRRARLPGKEALFGGLAEPQPQPAEGSTSADTPTDNEVNQETGKPVNMERVKHVQVCVWLDPKVAHSIEQVKAQLLVEHGIKTTKSKIVEVALRHVLSDEDLLLSLLEAHLSPTT